MSDFEHPAEALFEECRLALDELTDRYRDFIKGSNYPSTYEADMAAAQLLTCAFLHANALSQVAEIPYIGSHLIPSQCLCRAAFEAGLTAFWLAEQDDWRLREARWLRWIGREEKYRSGLSQSFQDVDPGFAGRLAIERQELAGRREAITELLRQHLEPDQPAPELQRSPSFEEMLRDLGLVDLLYARYRLLSHVLHSGPTSAASALRSGGSTIGMYLAHSPADWNDIFALTGFALYAPLPSFGKRIGVESEKLKMVEGAWHDLRTKAEALHRTYALSGVTQ